MADEIPEMNRAEFLAGFLNEAMEYLQDPKAQIPAIIQSLEEMSVALNNAANGNGYEGAELTDIQELQTQVFINFFANNSPNGLSAEQIQNQLSAMFETAQMDDGNVSPQEVLGSLIIAGGIVDENSYMNAGSFQMAAELLEEMGMEGQIDTYGATLAHYLDGARYDLMGFVDKYTSRPEEPAVENSPLEKDASLTMGIGQSR